MITIRQLLGGLLAETTKARVIADVSSVEIAQRYLGHDLLRGFPVPRMHVRDVEVEFSFAVADQVRSVSIFEDEERRRNVLFRLRSFLEHLPEEADLSQIFAQSPGLAGRWSNGLDGLLARIDKGLSQPGIAERDVAANVCRMVENQLHELAQGPGAGGLGGWLRATFVTPSANPGPEDAQTGRANDFITRSVVSILRDVAGGNGVAGEADGLCDFQVLIGAIDLEKVNPAKLQKLKLTFSANDRGWVAQDDGGSKKYILSKH